MPGDDLPTITPEQSNRIITCALNSKKLKEKAGDTTALVNELGLEYARSLNRIVFDRSLDISRDNSEDNTMLSKVTVEFEKPRKRRSVDMPKYDFAQSFSKFHCSTLLTVPEVIPCIGKAKTECHKVVQMAMFNTGIAKTLRPEEFEQMQTQAFSAVASQLKDSWITSLKNSIKNGLKDINKGWYTLTKTRQDIYEMSKLKQFMTMLKFMMEDALRSLVESSLLSFTLFVEAAAVGETVVERLFEEKFTAAPPKARKWSMLLIELGVLNGKVSPTYSLDHIQELPAILFDNAITSLAGMPQLDPLILTDMFWSYKPMLEVVNKQEPKVIGWRDRISGCMQRAMDQLREYVKIFDEYSPIIEVDPAEFVKEIQQQNLPIDQIMQMIQQYLSKREQLDEKFGGSVVVGMFSVQTEQIRKILSARYLERANLLLECLAVRIRSSAEEIAKGFQVMFDKMRKQPGNIEEVMAAREFIQKIPQGLPELEQRIEAALSQFDALEDLKFNFTFVSTFLN